MLADRLKMTVARVRSDMSAEELVGWRALYRVEANEQEHRRKVQGRRQGR